MYRYISPEEEQQNINSLKLVLGLWCKRYLPNFNKGLYRALTGKEPKITPPDLNKIHIRVCTASGKILTEFKSMRGLSVTGVKNMIREKRPDISTTNIHMFDLRTSFYELLDHEQVNDSLDIWVMWEEWRDTYFPVDSDVDSVHVVPGSDTIVAAKTTYDHYRRWYGYGQGDRLMRTPKSATVFMYNMNDTSPKKISTGDAMYAKVYHGKYLLLQTYRERRVHRGSSRYGWNEFVGYNKTLTIQNIGKSGGMIFRSSMDLFCNKNVDLPNITHMSFDGRYFMIVGENNEKGNARINKNVCRVFPIDDGFSGNLVQKGAIVAVDSSHDGRIVMTKGQKGIKIWHLNEKTNTTTSELVMKDGRCRDAKITGDGKHLIMVFSGIIGGKRTGNVVVMNLATRMSVKVITKKTGLSTKYPIQGIFTNSDPDYVMIVRNNTVYAYSIRYRKIIRRCVVAGCSKTAISATKSCSKIVTIKKSVDGGVHYIWIEDFPIFNYPEK